MLEKINEDALENVTGGYDTDSAEFDRAWLNLKRDKDALERAELFHQWIAGGKQTDAFEFLLRHL